MFIDFVKCYKDAFSEAKLTIPQYLGIDIRPRSHIESLSMCFMVLGAKIICLRANLREHEDAAWSILISRGIETVYHLPSLPMTIKQTDLKTAKP